jgi:hypothetical protein
MTTSQPNNSHKDKEMELKKNDEVVVVDEIKTTVSEANQVDPTSPCDPTIVKDVKLCNKRWMESLSDCA